MRRGIIAWKDGKAVHSGKGGDVVLMEGTVEVSQVNVITLFNRSYNMSNFFSF